MDDSQFDDLSKVFSKLSRRGVLVALGAVLLRARFSSNTGERVSAKQKRHNSKHKGGSRQSAHRPSNGETNAKKNRSRTGRGPTQASAQPFPSCPSGGISACSRQRKACINECVDRGGTRRGCRKQCDQAYDACVALCRPTPGGCQLDTDCNDGSACTRNVCNLATGQCEFPVIAGCCTGDAQCTDTNICTHDTCDLTTNTCVNQPVADCCTSDAECATANPCSVDSCDLAGRMCVHTAIDGCCRGDGDCDDSNPCSRDACDPQTNTCTHTPVADCCRTDDDCPTCQTCSGQNRCVADFSEDGIACRTDGDDGSCCSGACVVCGAGLALDPETCECTSTSAPRTCTTDTVCKEGLGHNDCYCGFTLTSATDSGTMYCLNSGTAGGCGFAKEGDFTCPSGYACQGGTLCTGLCMY